MSDETGINNMPVVSTIYRQHTYLESIDDIIDHNMAGCEDCDEYFNDIYSAYYECNPALWSNYDTTWREFGYSHLLAKLFLTYYLTIPQIPDEAKRGIRNLSIEQASSFISYDIFGIANGLNKLLYAYAETAGWKITDIAIPLSVFDEVEEDEEVHQRLREFFPEWLKEAVGGKPRDLGFMSSLHLTYELKDPIHLIIWESKDLYKLWENFLKYPRAYTYEEMEIYYMFSILERSLFRANPLLQGYMGKVVSNDHQTVAIYSMVGYELIGDDCWYSCKIIKQAYVYRWSCIEILEWLRKAIRKVCEKN